MLYPLTRVVNVLDVDGLRQVEDEEISTDNTRAC